MKAPSDSCGGLTSPRLRVVEVEVLADLVEHSGDDLLLDRLRIGRVDVLVRALPVGAGAQQR